MFFSIKKIYAPRRNNAYPLRSPLSLFLVYILPPLTPVRLDILSPVAGVNVMLPYRVPFESLSFFVVYP